MFLSGVEPVFRLLLRGPPSHAHTLTLTCPPRTRHTDRRRPVGIANASTTWRRSSRRTLHTEAEALHIAVRTLTPSLNPPFKNHFIIHGPLGPPYQQGGLARRLLKKNTLSPKSETASETDDKWRGAVVRRERERRVVWQSPRLGSRRRENKYGQER